MYLYINRRAIRTMFHTLLFHPIFTTLFVTSETTFSPRNWW